MDIITFSGVDGAGKTTILREFTGILETKYNKKVKELRHRPSLLPILSAIKHGSKQAELNTLDVLPRSGTNKSRTSSYIRFFYYLMDYVVGQWIIYFKYTRRGFIVIYDRYYFDFINDPQRTNINLNSNFIKFFYCLVFKPKLNIFLYAPPEIILGRKQEMDEKSIISLTDKYLKLFSNLSDNSENKYCCIENIRKEKTMAIIEKEFIDIPKF